MPELSGIQRPPVQTKRLENDDVLQYEGWWNLGHVAGANSLVLGAVRQSVRRTLSQGMVNLITGVPRS